MSDGNANIERVRVIIIKLFLFFTRRDVTLGDRLSGACVCMCVFLFVSTDLWGARAKQHTPTMSRSTRDYTGGWTCALDNCSHTVCLATI